MLIVSFLLCLTHCKGQGWNQDNFFIDFWKNWSKEKSLLNFSDLQQFQILKWTLNLQIPAIQKTSVPYWQQRWRKVQKSGEPTKNKLSISASVNFSTSPKSGGGPGPLAPCFQCPWINATQTGNAQVKKTSNHKMYLMALYIFYH